MGSHPYEYDMLVEYINPNDKGKYPHFSNLEYREGLTRTIEEIFTHLTESIPEKCEIISHNITHSQDTFILTILLKKKRIAGPASA